MINVNGLLCHIDQLRLLLLDLNLDVLTINETKLSLSIPSELVRINGYFFERLDRSNRGGGVAMYIRDSINYKVRNDLVPDQLEMIAVEISKSKAKPFIISTFYRPPSAAIELLDFFEIFLQKVDSEDKESILVGDINCNLATGCETSLSRHIQFLYDTYQYSQLINDFTRVTPKSSSIIDHLITNQPNKICYSGVLPISISDHYMIYGIRKFSSTKGEPRYIENRSFKNYISDS